MDTAAIWLLRMFLKLLDLLDLNSLAGLLVEHYGLCRRGVWLLGGNEHDGTYECYDSLWLGYLLWVIVIASGYLAYKRFKKKSQS